MLSELTKNDQAPPEVWDQKDLDVNVIDSELSTVMNDDFLIMDGIEIEDDFTGLLDLSPVNAFESSQDSPKTSLLEQNNESTDGKRPPEAPLSPPRKRRRSSQSGASCDSPMSSASSVVTSPPPILDLGDTIASTSDDPYKLALKQLALSMQRSELTRNEIIRQRRLAEAQASLPPTPAVSNANRFFTGSRATLTVGLEQSRRMLQAYMGQMKTL